MHFHYRTSVGGHLTWTHLSSIPALGFEPVAQIVAVLVDQNEPSRHWVDTCVSPLLTASGHKVAVH